MPPPAAPPPTKHLFGLGLTAWVPGATPEEAEANAAAIRGAVEGMVLELEAAHGADASEVRSNLRDG